ncbi:MAG: glycosyltransferase [Sphingobacteriales bacterium]|nr:glycosyltransferase [Sphingobacteriales bacterium]
MMIILSVKVLLCSLAVAYFVLMRVYVRAWRQLPKSSISQDFVPSTGISVIIPARNEAANIENCVRSIVAQHYPAALFEIIIVDDHSEDDTALLVKNLRLPQVQVLDLAAYLQGKKHQLLQKSGYRLRHCTSPPPAYCVHRCRLYDTAPLVAQHCSSISHQSLSPAHGSGGF